MQVSSGDFSSFGATFHTFFISISLDLCLNFLQSLILNLIIKLKRASNPNLNVTTLKDCKAYFCLAVNGGSFPLSSVLCESVNQKGTARTLAKLTGSYLYRY